MPFAGMEGALKRIEALEASNKGLQGSVAALEGSIEVLESTNKGKDIAISDLMCLCEDLSQALKVSAARTDELMARIEVGEFVGDFPRLLREAAAC